ncbi:conjugal transfer protein [Leuconostoc pseudomesenteroides]|uniref:conjugal transfer protein n=1 Tax=Leuconostoc pseudomesenteroides TaxID=33968 RepID=UPI0032E047F6
MRKKIKSEKLPKSHIVDLRRVRLVFFIGLIVVIAYCVLLVFRTGSVIKQNHTLKEQVVKLNTKLDKSSAGTTSYNPIVGQYLGAFITNYYTFSTDKSSEWVKSVQPYLAKDLLVTNSLNTTNSKLVKAKMNGVFTVDSVRTAQFEITLSVNDKQSDLVVNVPYAQDNDKLTVVGLPYVANAIDSVGQVASSRFSKIGKQVNDSEVRERVQKFTKQFAQKYVSSSTKDMSLLMSNPVGLNGAVDLVSLDDSSMRVTGSESNPVVTAQMTVQIHDTDIKQVQTIRLELKKQSATYFVTKFLQA